ncbi:LPXTG cell wall anchor domain-containing protein, partial [Lactococcus lactis]|uniref:LPXTG cell wall anchor domain-containing protein n=1 Tax=Lactococcus lactis TaxID=1358 RepID=UPI0039824C9D
SEYILDSDIGNTGGSHTNNSTSKNGSSYLPKTGEEESSLDGVGGILAGLGMLTAIAVRKRKSKEQK